MRSVIFTVIAFALATITAAQDAEVIVNAPDSGFRLTIPEVGWTHVVRKDDDDLTTVAIGPAALGGTVQLSVQVTRVTDASDAAVDRYIQTLRASVDGQPGIDQFEDFVIEVDGRTAKGLQVRQQAQGQAYRVRVFFLGDRGMQYRFQFHAPVEAFDEHWPTVQRVLAGFKLTELSDEAQMRFRLRELAARCGTQVNWARDWNDASRRAREEGRLIVVAVHAVPGFQIGNPLNEGVFMSPEVLDLVEHRFVGWRWSAGLPAPFVDPDVFGLSGTTFGMGLLICSPDGEVLRQIFLLDPELVADGLRAALLEHADLAPPPAPPADADRAQRAAFLIDSGQLDAAEDLIGSAGSNDPRAIAYQRARLFHAKRDGASALAGLDRARSADLSNSTDPTDAELLLEEAAVRAGTGDNTGAAEALKRCLAESPDDSVRAKTLLLQGTIAWAEGATADTVRDTWHTVIRDAPDEPAAWIAAAALIGPALDLDLRPNLAWPSETAGQLATIPDPAPRTRPFVEAVALEEAVDWLLNHQSDRGAWETPAGVRDAQIAADPLTLATHSIVLLALTRAAVWFDEVGDSDRVSRCREAVMRGLRRYLDDRDLLRAHPRTVAFMDYTCWSASYGLFATVALLDPANGIIDHLPQNDRTRLREEADHLVRELTRIQSANGGWSYYLSGNVGGAIAGAAMSFTTATVLLALQDAAEAGIDVPEDVLPRGYDCLATLRGTNGNFEYMRRGPEAFQAGAVHPAGSAARGPVCTLALLRAGRLEPIAMQEALQTYAAHLAPYGNESRKALMHAGAAAQGSHYLLYDYSTAADALRRTAAAVDSADEATRAAARAAIVRELARCRSADGSFIDNPIIGAAAGTGLATLTLLDLREAFEDD